MTSGLHVYTHAPPHRHRHRNQHEHAHTTYSWVSNTLWEISYICVEENSYGGQLWETLLGYGVVGMISRFPSGRSQSLEVAFWDREVHEGQSRARGSFFMAVVRFQESEENSREPWHFIPSRLHQTVVRKLQKHKRIMVFLYNFLLVYLFKSCYNQTSQLPRSFPIMC